MTDRIRFGFSGVIGIPASMAASCIIRYVRLVEPAKSEPVVGTCAQRGPGVLNGEQAAGRFG